MGKLKFLQRLTFFIVYDNMNYINLIFYEVTNMKVCQNCNTQLEDSAVFCHNCGTAV